MSRTKFFLAVVAVIVLGVLAGWWIFGLGYQAPVSPVMEQAASSAPPRVTSGYCCQKEGETCVEVENAAACFAPGGKGFNTQEVTCTSFCKKIGILLKLQKK